VEVRGGLNRIDLVIGRRSFLLCPLSYGGVSMRTLAVPKERLSTQQIVVVAPISLDQPAAAEVDGGGTASSSEGTLMRVRS
jgi:hypothetical protein